MTFSNKDIIFSRSRGVLVSLYSVLLWPHLKSCVQLWAPQHKKYIKLLGSIERRAEEITESVRLEKTSEIIESNL